MTAAKRMLEKLPPEIARRVHPDWTKNEKAYWAKRDSLRSQFEGQWIGFADDRVVASGDSPVKVLHSAQRTGRHPFVTCVGREETPQRMRRSAYAYDSTYPGEPLPRASVEFRTMMGATGLIFGDAIPDTGADASALPWDDCQALRLNLEDGVPGLMAGVGGAGDEDPLLSSANLDDPWVGRPNERLIVDRGGFVAGVAKLRCNFNRQILVDFEPHSPGYADNGRTRSLASSAAYAIDA